MDERITIDQIKKSYQKALDKLQAPYQRVINKPQEPQGPKYKEPPQMLRNYFGVGS